MSSKSSRGFHNCSYISTWSQNCLAFPELLQNLPGGFITVQIFPDGLKTFRIFTDVFKIFKGVSKLFRYFQMVSKHSGWFQNCLNFSGWLQNLPDGFKTVGEFQIVSKLSGQFQNCQGISRWSQTISKFSLKMCRIRSKKHPVWTVLRYAQNYQKYEEHVLKEESMFSFSSRTMITQHAFCGFVVSSNHPYFGIVMRNSYARFVQNVFAREKLLSRKFLYSRQSHYPPWLVQKVSKPNEPRSVSPVFVKCISQFFFIISRLFCETG